jgi:hypothetical protein
MHVSWAYHSFTRLTLGFLGDDYEDEFGKFVPDEQIPEYLARMTRREHDIHKLREATGEPLSPLYATGF